jgi:hypothetical protein
MPSTPPSLQISKEWKESWEGGERGGEGEGGKVVALCVTVSVNASWIACSQLVGFSSGFPLALPQHQQLWSPSPEAEAQDLRDDMLQSSVRPDHQRWLSRVAAQMDWIMDVPAWALDVESRTR